MIGVALLAMLAMHAAADSIEIPCPEFHPSLDYPCKCSLNAINATRINCDGAVFAEFPLLPYRFYIQEFSQRGLWRQPDPEADRAALRRRRGHARGHRPGQQ